MTTISAKVIADSIGTDAPRLTTLHLRYPRFIHAELMTHRVFSRNARSSRAVPIAKLIAEVVNDPVIPLHWGAAQAGMQAYAECDAPVLWPHPLGSAFSSQEVDKTDAWLWTRDQAVVAAKSFDVSGYAKQLVNRLLEPFLHIDVLVTATEWKNFLTLRDHHAAEPHIQILARAVREAMAESEPTLLRPDQWHLPYITQFDEFEMQESGLSWDLRRNVSTARCARISYAPFDADKPDIEADLKLADQLATSGHWSPFEHQATPDQMVVLKGFIVGHPTKRLWTHPEQHGNLIGWRQNRKFFPNEYGENV